MNIKSSSDKLLVLGSGSIPYDFKEKFANRPYFNRVSWSFNQSTIFYDDPTRSIENVDLLGGWGIGTPDEWYLQEISEIVKIIANKIYDYEKGDQFKNLIFYGSSMGGFMSLQLATLVKNSVCVAEIPQLNLMKWPYWRTLKSQLFKGLSIDEIEEKHLYKLNVFELILKENYIPDAYLILDCSDERDFQTQYTEFLLNLDKLPFEDDKNKIKIRIDGKNNGHEQLGYSEVYDLLEDVCLLSDDSLKNLIKGIDDNEKSSLENQSQLIKYMTGRIDIKNCGANNSIELLKCSKETQVMRPRWFEDKEGKGIILQNHTGQIDFEFKCINGGELKTAIRGIHYKINSEIIPIYVKFTKLTINGEDLISNDAVVWHNNPLRFKRNVKDGEIIRIHAEWVPF